MHQRRFDDLGTPLSDVTFCVFDLETTGTSPDNDRITEVGAVKVRGGVIEGTLQTFVNPGRPIPPSITVLTGITEAMVLPAPPIGEVLATLLEFMGDAVLVGHNIRFDTGFMDAALVRSGRPRLTNRRVDTCRLARRLVRGEVPNCRLGTLAERFRLNHQPSHRALDDALATSDLLHVLLERAAGLGVTGLDDLLTLPTMAGHAQAAKLPLTAKLPRSPGVYLFTNGRDDVLYVGKATNLRSRVRSYFSGDDRRKVGPLLRQTQGINHLSCVHALDAGIREIRLIQTLAPHYNRQAADPSRYRYVRLTPDESGGRLSVTRTVDPAKGLHLGPLTSTSAARRAIEALTIVIPGLVAPRQRSNRRATSISGLEDLIEAGAMPQGGLAIQAVIDAFGGRSAQLAEALHATMAHLAGREMFEQAAALRDCAATLTAALADHHNLGWLHRSGAMVVEVRDQGGATLDNGLVTSVWGTDGQVVHVDTPLSPEAAIEAASHACCACGALDSEHSHLNGDRADPASHRPSGPVPAWLVDELRVVHRWLASHIDSLEIISASSGPASMWPKAPAFRMVGTTPARRGLAA